MMARSVFHDLFPEEEAAELEMRAKLLSGINKWLNKSGLTQTEAAKQLLTAYLAAGSQPVAEISPGEKRGAYGTIE